MPELPEVETVRRGLRPILEGQKIRSLILRRQDLRIPFPRNIKKIATDRNIIRLERRAKYLLMCLENDHIIIIHLGMSGHMKILKNNIPKPGKHDHVDFCLANGNVVRFNDPRRFGLISLSTKDGLETHKLIKNIGPDPLGNKFNHFILAEAFANRKISIKAALLNQKIVGGLGNIYANESLFRSGISPMRLANSLNLVEAQKLTDAIRNVLREAIKAGGSSLNDHMQPNGKLGYFQNKFKVYGKKNTLCPGCSDRIINKIIQSGRSTFYCPLCQV